MQSALRLWRVLAGHGAIPNPARLTAARRSRLTLALRALDGHSAKASYREIAAALFSRRAIPERGWKTHDLRDRTIRLVRTGRELMQGGYRALLLYPYRRRSRPHDDS